MTVQDANEIEIYLQHAITLQNAGQIKAAEQIYREILSVNPNQANANVNLGSILLDGSSAESSLSFFKTALEANPHESKCWLSYINALIQTRHFDDAQLVITYGLQAGLSGNEFDNLIKLLKKKCSDDSLSIVSSLPPSSVTDDLIYLFSEKHYEEVESKLLILLQTYPDWLVGWKILSDTLLVQKKDARNAASRALSLNIKDAKEHCYYGLVLKDQGELKSAEKAFEQAILLKPDYAAAYNNLGIVKKDLGDVEGGISSYRSALKFNPNYASCFSNLLFCLSHSEKIDVDSLFKEHCQFGNQYELPIKSSWPIHTNSHDSERCLNVGFVSADFRDHSLAYFIEPLLKNLRLSSNLALFAYATNAIKDSMTQRLRENFNIWNEVDAYSDIEFAQKIIDDRIDILVDLDGHTAGNRLLTFAMKPAPIQISWLGYLATTGLSSMDYYLADNYLLPPGKFDSQFTEKLVQLPANAPFTPYQSSPEINELPALKNGYITFACFNRPNKITQSVVNLWCKLLSDLPSSKLLLGAMPQDGSYEVLVDWFISKGINIDRLIFKPRSSMINYLNLHHEVDVCLDTFPSNGVTTTCHAVWMGVPTLCLEGKSLASRGALGIMKHIGLDDFVAYDEIDFLRKGLLLTSDIEKLSEVRKSLRNRFENSRLSQANIIAQSLEQAFRKMWKIWCSDLPAKSFQIKAID